MKIVFVNLPFGQIFPPSSRNSIGIIIYEIARRLAKSNEVIVYSKGDGVRKKEKCEESVNYQFIPTAFDHRFLLGILSQFSKFYNIKRPLFTSNFYYLGYILQIAYDLRMQNCDIVHIYDFSQFVPIIRAFNPKIKIILHMDCEWLTQLDMSMIEQRLSKVDLIIGCSEYITEKIRHRFPQFSDRCQTVYNGVDITKFSRKYEKNTKNNGTKKLLYVGRISPEKGVHILLMALKNVIEKYPQLKLEVVGPNSELPFEFMVGISDDELISKLASFYDRNKCCNYYIKLQEQLLPDLGNHVTFPGNILQSLLVTYYLDADVFIFPSVCNEAFGMPIIEAMSCEVPVVATRGGGIIELVEDGKSGILVERNDAYGLAQAILRLLLDDKLREKMGQSGRQRVIENFSWDRIVENLLLNYKNIL